jgi:hypothetical protein
MTSITRTSLTRARRNGARLPTPSARWIGQWWLWAPPVVVASSFLTGLLVANSPRAREEAEARRAIDACWDGFKALPGGDGTQFDPTPCQRLEASFQQRFGGTR